MIKKHEITHVFLGDDCEFLSKKFIGNILETSSLVHRFVIFTNKKRNEVWRTFFAHRGIGAERMLFLNTDRDSRFTKTFLRFWQCIRFMSFSSSHIISHRHHFNILFLLIIKMFGKSISFMCWGDVPAKAVGLRRVIQILRFKCYKMGLVQISSEEPLFKNLYRKLKVITIPYLRDNGKVLSQCSSDGTQRYLLIGNNCWYYHLYGDILKGLNWTQWDKVICMLNYGNEAQKSEIDAFCLKMRLQYGDKILFWRETLPFDEYLNYIAKCSLYIFPGETQGGIDLIYNMLLMGKKVACRGVNLIWLKASGCEVTDLTTLNLWTCGNDLLISDRARKRNQQIVCNLTDKNKDNIARWENVYLQL